MRHRRIIARVIRRWVHDASDARVEAAFARRSAQRLLMRLLADSFSPDDAGGFAGAIAFELTRPHADAAALHVWTITIEDRRAHARRGVRGKPTLWVRAPSADFVRVLVGDADADAIFESGRTELRGRLLIASRLGEMFRLRADLT